MPQWRKLNEECLLWHYKQGLYNRVVTIAYAANKIIGTIYNDRPSSIKTRLLVKSATSAQALQQAETSNFVDETIPLFKVFEFIYTLFEDKYKSDMVMVPFHELQDWAIFYHRVLTMARPQDPSQALLSLWTFKGGSSFSDCKSWHPRVHNTKDTLLAGANATSRPKQDRARNQVSSQAHVEHSDNLPPRRLCFFKQMMPEFLIKRERMEVPLGGQVTVNDGSGPKLHEPLYVHKRTKGGVPRGYTRDSTSRRILALMVRAGAIKPGSSLKAEHIRHSALTIVQRFLPKQFKAAADNARHAVRTAETVYALRVDPESVQHIEAYISSRAAGAFSTPELLMC